MCNETIFFFFYDGILICSWMYSIDLRIASVMYSIDTCLRITCAAHTCQFQLFFNVSKKNESFLCLMSFYTEI